MREIQTSKVAEMDAEAERVAEQLAQGLLTEDEALPASSRLI